MAILTSINMGYLCGELHGLAASVRVWTRYHWVLYCQVDSSFNEPVAVEKLWADMATAERLGAAYLGDYFPAPPHHFRYSLLNFVFWPSRVQRLPRKQHYLQQQGLPRELDLGRWPMHGLAPADKSDKFWSVWREATRWCLFGLQSGQSSPSGQVKATTLIPEVMMAEDVSPEKFPLYPSHIDELKRTELDPVLDPCSELTFSFSLLYSFQR